MLTPEISLSESSAAISSDVLLKDGMLIGILLLMIYTMSAAIIEAKKIKWIHESGIAIILGMITSFVFYWI